MKTAVAKWIVMLAAAAAATLTTAASAQFGTPGVDLLDISKQHHTAEEKEKMDQINRDYQATIKKVPDKKKAYDPWAGARQDSSNTSTTKQH
jgi:hypothetical protein